jgi:hypothetical protein
MFMWSKRRFRESEIESREKADLHLGSSFYSLDQADYAVTRRNVFSAMTLC